jgi:hypothetical protein
VELEQNQRTTAILRRLQAVDYRRIG